MTKRIALIVLAVALAVPVFAQQSSQQTPAQPSTQSQPTQSQSQPDQQQQPSAQQNKADQSSATMATGKEPLVYESRQGFWGKVNPFARKKYVQKQVQPIRDRVNELDELTAANSKQINDVDQRAQAGLQQANSKISEADSHAVAAGNAAQQAQQTATDANTKLQAMNSTVNNLDQYQSANQVEIKFRPGATTLAKNAKDALDDFTSQLKDQKGYIIEVQGFSSGKGTAAVRSSKEMADAVVRYLVMNREVPVYRIYTIGMGNAPIPTQNTGEEGNTKAARRTIGGHVEVSLLHNGLNDMNKQPATGTPTTPSSPSGPGSK